MRGHRKSPKREICVECWKPWPCPGSRGVATPPPHPRPSCPHGMPTPASCVTCMEDGNLDPPPPPPPVLPELGPFAAKFAGECPECNLPINVGDQIVRWTDDRYRHERCTA